MRSQELRNNEDRFEKVLFIIYTLKVLLLVNTDAGHVKQYYAITVSGAKRTWNSRTRLLLSSIFRYCTIPQVEYCCAWSVSMSAGKNLNTN